MATYVYKNPYDGKTKYTTDPNEYKRVYAQYTADQNAKREAEAAAKWDEAVKSGEKSVGGKQVFGGTAAKSKVVERGKTIQEEDRPTYEQVTFKTPTSSGRDITGYKYKGQYYKNTAELQKAMQQDVADYESSQQYLTDARSAAENLAQEQAATTAGQVGRQTIQAAKTAGLSPAQAALLGAQQTGDVYQQTYQTGYNTGLGVYTGAQQQFAQERMQDKSLTAQQKIAQMQSDVQREIANKQLDFQKSQAWDAAHDPWSKVGTIAGGAGGLLSGIASLAKLSDKNAKTDIRNGADILDSVVESVKPYLYKYKGEGVDRPGVLAQDLEKTPLKSAVMETPQGKAVDTGHLALANTGMIAELGKRIDDIMSVLKEGK